MPTVPMNSRLRSLILLSWASLLIVGPYAKISTENVLSDDWWNQSEKSYYDILLWHKMPLLLGITYHELPVET